MSKEIANKTKEKIHPICKKIWMELSNGVNVRVGGNEEDRKVITK